ncbi:MAG: hypothetical protein REI12_00570 [Pedobacter sp.]|nr:hypothetical protein [Pedobacter sp.]
MKKLLSFLLVAWVLLVVLGGIGYMNSLGKHISGNGPQALSGDGQGGFFLIANRHILHFDAAEKVLERHSFDALGLQSSNGLLYGEGRLLAFDNERQQIFLCTLPAWQCRPFSAPSLRLSNAIAMTWQSPTMLAVSDNTGHRLLLLDGMGNLMYAGQKQWHYPNQITAVSDGLLLADTDRFSILHIADTGGAGKKILLGTSSRPYQFVLRDNNWWVLQAGIRLENASLFRYRDGIPEKISLPATDPTALLDTGKRLIIASRQDWELLSLDPDTGNAIPTGDTAFQKELTSMRLAQQTAKKQRGLAPYIMLALMAPALLGGVVLQRRMDAEKSSAKTIPTQTLVRPPATAFASESIRIDTDRSGIEMQRAQQNRLLLKAGLVVIPLFLLIAAVIGLSGLQLRQLFPLLFFIAALLVLTPLLVYMGRLRQDRLFDQHFICGPQKLVHVKQGKPLSATAYADIWLGSDTLLLKDKAIPLYIGMGKLRTPFWTVHDIQREIGKRLPPAQHFHSDHEMGKALLGKNSLLGLRLILARYAVVFAIIAVLLLKLMQVLHQLHLDTLWKIFHPD